MLAFSLGNIFPNTILFPNDEELRVDKMLGIWTLWRRFPLQTNDIFI